MPSISHYIMEAKHCSSPCHKKMKPTSFLSLIPVSIELVLTMTTTVFRQKTKRLIGDLVIIIKVKENVI